MYWMMIRIVFFQFKHAFTCLYQQHPSRVTSLKKFCLVQQFSL